MDILVSKVQDRVMDFMTALHMHILQQLPYPSTDTPDKLDKEWQGLLADLHQLRDRNLLDETPTAPAEQSQVDPPC